MKKRTLPFMICLLLAGQTLLAQSVAAIKDYITKYKDAAMEEMQRTGIPAAITLAQGIHETEAGTSDLVLKSNNHFGIKCKSNWTGETVSHDDDARGECFRKYTDPLDSYKDHSDFLKSGPRYAFLFNLDPMDYEAWAWGLKKAGYATNPKYPQILIKLIKDYNLQDYTLIAMGKKQAEPTAVWASANNPLPANTEPSKMSGPNVNLIARQMNYPQGVFKINETSVVFVPKGTAYLAIAESYNISLHRLFEFNDMEESDVAPVDQLVFLQRKRKAGANDQHTVLPGETVYDIAQSEGLRMESLLHYNFLKEGMQPQAGEVLYLRSDAPGMPRLATAQQEMVPQQEMPMLAKAAVPAVAAYIIHTVLPKETMYSIAKRYAVTIDDLQKWNNMNATDLKTGQQLRINKKMENAVD